MQSLFRLALAAALSVATLSAQAALVARPGGMVYDTVQDITWLQNWNYAQTSSFAADGRMDWTTANNWANNLVYGGFDDWRLPTSLNGDGSSFSSGPCGPEYNCDLSHMGYMFYTNWRVSRGNAFSRGTNAANLALFSNVQSWFYWSSTEHSGGLLPSRGTSAPLTAGRPATSRPVSCMPWLCATAMWPPLCRSHRRWHWCCWRWARRWWCVEGGQFDALTLRALSLFRGHGG